MLPKSDFCHSAHEYWTCRTSSLSSHSPSFITRNMNITIDGDRSDAPISADDMFEGMTEISLDRTERAEVSLEDEFQNCEAKRMDACDCVVAGGFPRSALGILSKARPCPMEKEAGFASPASVGMLSAPFLKKMSLKKSAVILHPAHGVSRVEDSSTTMDSMTPGGPHHLGS